MVENSNLVFDLLTKQNGEIYVCGRRALAEGVYSSLIDILTKLNYTEDDAVKFLDSMKVIYILNRFYMNLKNIISIFIL